MSEREPMKDAYYFSHDTNAFLDPKIRSIISEFGVLAYGVFWIIIEMLAAQKDYKIRRENFERVLCPLLQGKRLHYNSENGIGFYKDESGSEIAADQVGCHCISLAYTTALFGMMLKIGLFDKNREFFWSSSLIERMQKRSQNAGPRRK